MAVDVLDNVGCLVTTGVESIPFVFKVTFHDLCCSSFKISWKDFDLSDFDLTDGVTGLAALPAQAVFGVFMSKGPFTVFIR